MHSRLPTPTNAGPGTVLAVLVGPALVSSVATVLLSGSPWTDWLLAPSQALGFSTAILGVLGALAGPGTSVPDPLMSSVYLLVAVGVLGHVIRDLDPNVPSTSEDLF